MPFSRFGSSNVPSTVSSVVVPDWVSTRSGLAERDVLRLGDVLLDERAVRAELAHEGVVAVHPVEAVDAVEPLGVDADHRVREAVVDADRQHADGRREVDALDALDGRGRLPRQALAPRLRGDDEVAPHGAVHRRR